MNSSTGFDRTWSVDRLHAFARTCALRDRSARHTWIPDEDLESAFHGYATCVAIVTHSTIVLTATDVDGAIHCYRRARRLKARSDRSQRRLITVVGKAA
jgi:hypothetical protein